MKIQTKQALKAVTIGVLATVAVGHRPAYGQSTGTDGPTRQMLNWPLTVGIQFHNVGMPLRDLASAFTNIGFSVGTEFSYNQRSNLVQGFQVGYSRNRAVGDAVLLYTQAIYRPGIGPFFAEVKAGIGAMQAFRPTETFVLTDQKWQSVRQSGKALLMVPLGVSVGYMGARRYPTVVPSVSYQFIPVLGVNASVPLIPHQFIQVNSRIRF